MNRLYDELRIIRDKEQKINIKDNGEMVLTGALKGDIPMRYVSRDVFSATINDDHSITYTLLSDMKRKPAGKGMLA